MRRSISLFGVSSWSFLLRRSADFSVPAGNRIFIIPCRRWRILDAHALPPPVKPAKSRQIVANATADRVRLIRQDQRTAGMARLRRLLISTEQDHTAVLDALGLAVGGGEEPRGALLLVR